MFRHLRPEFFRIFESHPSPQKPLLWFPYYTMIELVIDSRNQLIFAEGSCGRIPRKDFQCRISICGRILRKDFAEGCGRIQKNKQLFCWPIFAEGSLRKDSGEGFSMQNQHLRKDPRKDFAEGFRKDPRKDPRGRKQNKLRAQS